MAQSHLDAFNAEEEKIRAGAPDAIHIGHLSYNIKEWERGTSRREPFNAFLRHTGNVVLDSIPSISCVSEQPGTVVGSGCAIFNTLKDCPLTGSDPELAFLAAGEGSRLWGACLAGGAVKGLVTVLGRTLFEQTANQALMLLAQLPNRGRDMVVIAGTDNVFLPSNYPLLVGQSPLSAHPVAGLYQFSKDALLMDEGQQEVLSADRVREMTQLGVMVLDPATGAHPVLFHEKPTAQAVVEICRTHKTSRLFYNAFCFAMTKEAARFLVGRFSAPSHQDPQTPLYLLPDLDWSTHVLEPLAAQSVATWEARWAGSQQAIIRHSADWRALWDIAQEFKGRFGAPAVVRLGSEAVWYDAGLSRDLVQLHRLLLPPAEPAPARPTAAALLRGLFGLPPTGNAFGVHCPPGASVVVDPAALVVNCVFLGGGSVGPGAVLNQCVFRSYVSIPANTVMLTSLIDTLDPASAPGCLVYGYRDARLAVREVPAPAAAAVAAAALPAVQSGGQRPTNLVELGLAPGMAGPLRLDLDGIYFTCEVDPGAVAAKGNLPLLPEAARQVPLEASGRHVLRGRCVLSVLPKDKGTRSYFRHYNLDRPPYVFNAGRSYLNQLILPAQPAGGPAGAGAAPLLGPAASPNPERDEAVARGDLEAINAKLEEIRLNERQAALQQQQQAVPGSAPMWTFNELLTGAVSLRASLEQMRLCRGLALGDVAFVGGE
ncbi:hypothetical protein PAPYR_1757 [Paratrimastix pyriformis]|uniref:Uncharacterized protein n=1 Tax=Paratrimastix pyriformis TaxID=342808 RepID=A0ABQ8UWB6_9EUKA|nr:hypothetical protein PAPYR_1757 [Paratrimastix pyriformis]